MCFEKDALGENIPSHKTIISKNHEILHKSIMTKAKDFIGKYINVYKIEYTGEPLYNVLLENLEKVVIPPKKTGQLRITDFAISQTQVQNYLQPIK